MPLPGRSRWACSLPARTIAEQSERLTDDGAGRLQMSTERSARWCTGCRRPITDVAEFRGICDYCHQRECCVHCISKCAVCSRRLCGHCRKGFAGRSALTACAACLGHLTERQILEDRLAAQQTAFDRYEAQQRLINQVEALRLNAERMRIMERFQAAR